MRLKATTLLLSLQPGTEQNNGTNPTVLTSKPTAARNKPAATLKEEHGEKSSGPSIKGNKTSKLKLSRAKTGERHRSERFRETRSLPEMGRRLSMTMQAHSIAEVKKSLFGHLWPATGEDSTSDTSSNRESLSAERQNQPVGMPKGVGNQTDCEDIEEAVGTKKCIPSQLLDEPIGTEQGGTVGVLEHCSFRTTNGDLCNRRRAVVSSAASREADRAYLPLLW